VNEDGMSIAAVGSALIAVICDGVSSTPGSGPAAQAAAHAARAVLADAVNSHQPDLASAMLDAVGTARSAVLAAQAPDPERPPSCTLAAAAVRDEQVTIGWIGDTRIYWIDTEHAERLTVPEDSWIDEVVQLGHLTEEAAERNPRAHEITRWLGRDLPDAEPHQAVYSPQRPGRVVVCSDGLWNYAQQPEDLFAQLKTMPLDTWPIDVARRLTSFALNAGGQDNVTVAIAATTGSKG
jgi:serine/threonine protein phosphatase PrpC